MNEKAEKVSVSKAEKRYTRDRLLASEAYKDKRDLLRVLLDGNREYTKSEVSILVDGYLQRSVM